jgi:hypothetical protein
MGKDSILRNLATIGEIIKYSIVDNHLYACVEPHDAHLGVSDLNIVNALNPTWVEISGCDDSIYLKVEVKID